MNTIYHIAHSTFSCPVETLLLGNGPELSSLSAANIPSDTPESSVCGALITRTSSEATSVAVVSTLDVLTFLRGMETGCTAFGEDVAVLAAVGDDSAGLLGSGGGLDCVGVVVVSMVLLLTVEFGRGFLFARPLSAAVHVALEGPGNGIPCETSFVSRCDLRCESR